MSEHQRAVARALMTTHGRSTTPEYRSWKAMLQRCLNPSFPRFKDYGARGITVCDRWRRFEEFFADMGERPAGKTLDRWPDKDGNYEPGNCRWATPKEQQANRRIDHARETEARKRSWITRRRKQQEKNDAV